MDTKPLISDADLQAAAYKIADGMSFSITAIQRVEQVLKMVRDQYEAERKALEPEPEFAGSPRALDELTAAVKRIADALESVISPGKNDAVRVDDGKP